MRSTDCIKEYIYLNLPLKVSIRRKASNELENKHSCSPNTKQILSKCFIEEKFLVTIIGTSTTTKDELCLWLDHLQQCQKQYGKKNMKTTDCMINLGYTYMRQECYDLALATFKNVVRIRKSIVGNDHLSVGRALDCVGRAAAFTGELKWGLIALYEAFHIRFRALGPWHIDVADTLNNIAGIFFRMNEMVLAEEAYIEVLSVRKAVWGNNHPSVAVTSCSLGKTQLRLSNLTGACGYFNEALRIYRVSMNLPNSSPIVKRVRKHITRTERLMVSMDVCF